MPETQRQQHAKPAAYLMEETPIPEPYAVGGGAKLYNPWVGKFPTPEGKALRVTVHAPADSREVRRVAAQATRAAHEVNRTACIRTKQTPAEAGRETTVVTAWTVAKLPPRRKRTPAPKDDDGRVAHNEPSPGDGDGSGQTRT